MPSEAPRVPLHAAERYTVPLPLPPSKSAGTLGTARGLLLSTGRPATPVPGEGPRLTEQAGVSTPAPSPPPFTDNQYGAT